METRYLRDVTRKDVTKSATRKDSFRNDRVGKHTDIERMEKIYKELKIVMFVCYWCHIMTLESKL